jgi:uncharacterized protein (TIGR03067 family)
MISEPLVSAAAFFWYSLSFADPHAVESLSERFYNFIADGGSDVPRVGVRDYSMMRRHKTTNTIMKIIQRLFLTGVAAATFCSVSAEENEAVKKDLARFQGEWSMVSGSADGQPMPDEMRGQMKRICKGDETATTMRGQMFMKAKITIDPSKKPKTIDYQMIDGFTKGKKQLGIYEVDGDTFKSCFAKPGDERPTDFTSKPGDGRTLSVWKRDKPAEPAREQK